MKTITLFSTDGCHLCEQAIGMFYYGVQAGCYQSPVSLTIVDIISDDELTALYGERIPVFKYQDRELGWPIELAQLADWVNQN
ncbi:MAG: glutaredoxin family protein [Gammaproteobacteria bacterium]|nr:glutaredoxin family protein [Gammaproteobacteria bacterium]NVK89615.1 glutaredoxin family protein [Gammaproteobacteria bacterium]